MTERSRELLKQFSHEARRRYMQNELPTAAAEDEQAADASNHPMTMLAPRPIPLSKINTVGRAKRLVEQERLERDRESRIYGHFLRLQASKGKSRHGEKAARLEWMSAAKVLVQEFRSDSIFYPADKYMRFLGYTSEARARSAAAKPSIASTETKNSDSDLYDQSSKIILYWQGSAEHC